MPESTLAISVQDLRVYFMGGGGKSCLFKEDNSQRGIGLIL